MPLLVVMACWVLSWRLEADKRIETDAAGAPSGLIVDSFIGYLSVASPP